MPTRLVLIVMGVLALGAIAVQALPAIQGGERVVYGAQDPEANCIVRGADEQAFAIPC